MRWNAPPEAHRLPNPAVRPPTEADLNRYIPLCGSCHGPDGRSRTKAAGALPVRPTDLTNYLMESMKDGEIYWVTANGIESRMPAFGSQLSEAVRWQMVMVVRELRARQRAREKSPLGPYECSLPPSFPYPKVPADNPMTAKKTPYAMEFLVPDKQFLATLQPGRKFTAGVRKRGTDYYLEPIPQGAKK